MRTSERISQLSLTLEEWKGMTPIRMNSEPLRRARKYRLQAIRILSIARRMCRAMELCLSSINEHAFEKTAPGLSVVYGIAQKKTQRLLRLAHFATDMCVELCIEAFNQVDGSLELVPSDSNEAADVESNEDQETGASSLPVY
ncbi:hypothetical protein DFH27DRAFT_609707 [Peziza echinospora]|nr:hypothetical protein DFH27DRAFT_609707 [Peziza echinospora]